MSFRVKCFDRNEPCLFLMRSFNFHVFIQIGPRMNCCFCSEASVGHSQSGHADIIPLTTYSWHWLVFHYSTLVLIMSDSSVEEAPLLPDSTAQDEYAQVYKRFSSRDKRVITAIVSWAGFIPCMINFRMSLYSSHRRKTHLLYDRVSHLSFALYTHHCTCH